MTRFTHSILATSLLLAASGISAQATGFNPGRELSGMTIGDLSSEFVYDQLHRLSSVESFASKVTFDYSPASIDGQDYDMTMRISDPTGDIICYLEIGDNGYITRSREIEETMGEQAPYKTYTFAYDTEGHLTRVSEIGIVDFSTTEFQYIDGNLVASTTIGSIPATRAISYTSPTAKHEIENVAGVMDFGIFGFDDIEARYLYNAGLLGTPTASLPVKSELVSNGTSTADTYIWNTDSNGSPTSRNTFSDNAFTGTTMYEWADICSIPDMLTVKNNASDTYFGINGMRHSTPTHGLNISLTSDGHVAKTFSR